MPGRLMPRDEDFKAEMEWYLHHKYNDDDIQKRASSLGYANAQSYHRAMRIYVAQERDKVIEQGEDPEAVESAVDIDIKLEKEHSETKHWKSRYLEVVKQLAKRDVILQAIKDEAKLIPATKVVTPKRIKRPIITDRGSETDLFQLSDLHSGEVVDPEETMGINEFNMQIMNRRVSIAFRKALELVELRRSSLYIPNLIISELGDMLSGDIHQELVLTNAGHMMNIATRTAFIISQGIHYIAPHFDTVEVRCVVGNHPRLYPKPHYKQKYVNWDYVCYQWQAVFCRDLKNVKFTIPRSPYDLFNIENTRVLAMHGDSVRSWMGIPWYGIERAVYRLREMLHAASEYFDAVILAHFHNRLDLDKAKGPIVSNGSLKGGDEYSQGSMQTTNRPSQNLLHFHSKNGYIGGQALYLREADDREDIEFVDYLPDVWVDLMSDLDQESRAARMAL